MRKIIIVVVALSLFVACHTNSVTGRKQLSLFSEQTLQQQAVTEYKLFLSQNKVVINTINKDAEMVKRVGIRIAKAISDYYSQKGLSDELNGYQWEFNLVGSKEINAWCMPGGKVVVYTGLLNVTQNEAALAIVMGHEITHAIAHHGNERISQSAMAQGIQIAGDVFTSGNKKANTLFNNIFSPSAQVGVLLPNSRKQELEADHFGLNFAAMAGYNPREAVPFWERMSKMGDGGNIPVFLATHPTNQKRIAELKKHMDEALGYYQPVRK